MISVHVLSRFSHVQLFATYGHVVCLTPLSMEFSRQEYCSGLPFPSPGNLSKPGIEPKSLKLPALVGGFFTTSVTYLQHNALLSYVSWSVSYALNCCISSL